jgi:hypothetical protein
MQSLTSDDPAEIGGYRLSARLGAGGMGRVYLAFTPGGRPVALKVVRPELSDDDAFRTRFRQEVDAARRVHGLYTAQVLDADPGAAPPWLVTAYVPGPSLHESVTAHGPMPAGTVLLMMAGVAEALEAIHSVGVVHRDLKPSNVVLAPDGPRVIDFGIARALDATAVTRSGMRVGSPQFMAPEQVTGQPTSAAIDVFSLGSLIAFAATARTPFGDGNEAAVLYRVVHEPPDLTGCPAALRELIERCLAKDPADRPAPTEIRAACQAQTTDLTLAIARAWLPPAVAAGLAEHVAPPPTTLTATASVTPPPGAAPRATARPFGPEQPFAPVLAAASAPRPWRRRIPRTAALASLAAVLVLGSGIGVSAALLSDHGRNRNGQAAGASTSKPASTPGARHHGRPHARLAVGASCLVGFWIGTSEDITGTIYGAPVIFTGRGPDEIYRADGTLTLYYGKGTALAVTVNGNKWTQLIKGTASAHYVIQNGLVLISDITEHGSSTLLENGSYNNGGPLTLVTAPYRYSCAGNTLREFPNNGSVEYTRRLAVSPHGTPPGS